MKSPGIRLILYASLICGPAAAGAQVGPAADTDGDGVRILGRVTDLTTGAPVPSASVTFLRLGAESEAAWEGDSGITGEFTSPRLRLGEYTLRIDRVGFSPVSHVIAFDEGGNVDLQIELVPEALPLAPVVVAVRRLSRLETSGFEARRDVGIGHFITRSEIEARDPLRVSDLFYRVPGARVVASGSGRLTSAIRLRGGCTPLNVIDGVPLSAPAQLDDLIQVSHVEGIEVYHGATAPSQFSRFTNCGTIVVWTRDPQIAEDSRFTWKRLMVGVGLLGTILLLGR